MHMPKKKSKCCITSTQWVMAERSNRATLPRGFVHPAEDVTSLPRTVTSVGPRHPCQNFSELSYHIHTHNRAGRVSVSWIYPIISSPHLLLLPGALPHASASPLSQVLEQRSPAPTCPSTHAQPNHQSLPRPAPKYL